MNNAMREAFAKAGVDKVSFQPKVTEKPKAVFYQLSKEVLVSSLQSALTLPYRPTKTIWKEHVSAVIHEISSRFQHKDFTKDQLTVILEAGRKVGM